MNSSAINKNSLVKHLPKLLPLLLAGVLFAGCGSSSPKPSAEDVAVVAGTHVTLAEYALALAEQKASLAAQGQKLPAAGSTQFAALKTQILDTLVQQAEIRLEAQKLGLSVTPADVNKQIAKIVKASFGGSDKAFAASIKKQGFSDSQIRNYLQEQLLEQKVYKQITKGAKVSAADIATYYATNSSQFQKAASRPVEEILVGKNKQALATQIYNQVKAGGDFAALAKKYSGDPGSKNTGGKFTANQGSDVPEFDAAVFNPKAKTGVVIKPVKTAQYGWFVIKPLADVTPAKVTPEKTAAATIRKTLLGTKQQQLASDWMTKTSKTYCSAKKIVFQSSYQPTTDPCATLDSSNPTTT